MGTAWVLAAMAAAVGAFIFGRGRSEPASHPDHHADTDGAREGLSPGDFTDADETQPCVAAPAPKDRLHWPA